MRDLALFIFALTAILVWLPLVRAVFEGDAYRWAMVYFGVQVGGQGLGGDFWLLAVLAVAALVIVGFGFRNPGRGFYRLFLLWLGAHAGSFFYDWVRAPGALLFEGETLGIKFDLGLAAAGVYFSALLIALLALQLEYGAGRRPAHFRWTRTNSVLLGLGLALFPVEFALLRSGAQHGPADEFGVLLTMAQWLAIVYAIAANRRRPA